jgi:hypothetical protein
MHNIEVVNFIWHGHTEDWEEEQMFNTFPLALKLAVFPQKLSVNSNRENTWCSESWNI